MLPTTKQWKQWSLPSKYSLIGLLLGIAGLLPIVAAIIPQKIAGKPQDPATPVLVKAKQEIVANLRCFNSYRMLVSSGYDWPLCKTSHAALDEFMQNYFYILGYKAYGEDGSLLWQWGNMNRAMDMFNKAGSGDELRTLETASQASLRDLYFEQAFMLWYLGPALQEYVGERFDPSQDTPRAYTGIDDAEWRTWPLRVVRDHDRRPVGSFGDWLALLD